MVYSDRGIRSMQIGLVKVVGSVTCVLRMVELPLTLAIFLKPRKSLIVSGDEAVVFFHTRISIAATMSSNGNGDSPMNVLSNGD